MQRAVGAHIGTFSLLAASKVPKGQVYAIEASTAFTKKIDPIAGCEHIGLEGVLQRLA